jgi:glutamine amidotransferase
VGWNEVMSRRPGRLLTGLPDGASFYFVHSYCYENPDAEYVVGICDYGLAQVALIELGSVFGAQFHPEKSQKNGLALLRNFISV